MKNSTALRTVTVGTSLFFAPFVGKNCWVQKEEGPMKVTKDTTVYSFDGEAMVPTSFAEVRAQK